MTSEERREARREYYKAHKAEFRARQDRYTKKRISDGGIVGFFGCDDCRTCRKTNCRHNHSRTA